jgi:hypothetical protein
MTSLYDKICAIYPELTSEDFYMGTGTISLVNEGNGDFIAAWNHPTLAQPTQDQLDAI